MTIREIISTVRNAVKSINLDDRINNRFIYSLLTHYATSLIKRDNDSRRLFKQTNLFKTVNCFELEESDLVSSCNILIPNCKTVMKSKIKLPKFYTTIYGNLLSVHSIDGYKTYNYIDPSSYVDYLNREFKPKNSGVFWISNEYLIIPSTVEVVMIRGLFSNQAEIDKLNGVNTETSNCKSILDNEFVAPEYLIGDIIKLTITDIRNITVPLQEDAVPNLNSGERQVRIDNE